MPSHTYIHTYIHTYVLHVKKGYESRGEHIRKMLSKIRLPFELILEGDMCDLTDNTLNKYFSREMHKIAPDTSCALKHLLAYEAILNNNYPGALILEDDIILHKNFRKYLYK